MRLILSLVPSISFRRSPTTCVSDEACVPFDNASSACSELRNRETQVTRDVTLLLKGALSSFSLPLHFLSHLSLSLSVPRISRCYSSSSFLPSSPSHQRPKSPYPSQKPSPQVSHLQPATQPLPSMHFMALCDSGRVPSTTTGCPSSARPYLPTPYSTMEHIPQSQ